MRSHLLLLVSPFYHCAGTALPYLLISAALKMRNWVRAFSRKSCMEPDYPVMIPYLVVLSSCLGLKSRHGNLLSPPPSGGVASLGAS